MRVGGRQEWIGYSSVSAAKVALEWVLDELLTESAVAELRRRLEQRLNEGPAQEEKTLKERQRQLEVTMARLKVLALRPELGDVYADELCATAQDMRLVSSRLDRLRESVRHITPQVLARQMEIDVPQLVRRLLDGNVEVYKVRATLRRLLSEFKLVGRPERGVSVFRVALEPGVSLAEFSDTPLIDPVAMTFSVEVRTSHARPTRWTVEGQRI
jgi:site-specific DNA recombinase